MTHLWIQASIITNESPSICSLLKQPCLANKSLANNVWALEMLFVPIGKGDTVSATTSPKEFLIHAPKIDGPGFPLDVPSKFNFQRPNDGGLQMFFQGKICAGGGLIFHPL